MFSHFFPFRFCVTIFGKNLDIPKYVKKMLMWHAICRTCIDQQSEAPPLQPKGKKEPERKPSEVVVAIYDFHGAEQGDLSLSKVLYNNLLVCIINDYKLTPLFFT